MNGGKREPHDLEDDWDDPTEITEPTGTPLPRVNPTAQPQFDLVIEEEEESIQDLDVEDLEVEDLDVEDLEVEELEDLDELVDLAPIDHEFPGGPAFVVLEPDEPARVFWVHDDLILGRGADVHIPMASPAISRRHASILLTAEGCVLEDLLSDNGTFVNNEQVERKVLWPGDTVRIANVELQFLGYSEDEQRYDDEPATALPRYEWQLPPWTDSETMMMDGRLMARQARVRTLLSRGVLRAAESDERWRLGHERRFLGGEEGIPVAGSVLERAAEINWTGTAHQLRKMSRRAPVVVNGRDVEEHNLEPGDTIVVGKARFEYGLD